jgi:heptosyltransferase-2
MRFLIVRLAALGDIAVTTPLLSRIRAEHPDAHVAWLCGVAAAPLVSLFPGVDEVITVDERALLRGGVARRSLAMLGLWRRLWGRKYDVVLLLHADRRYRMLTWPLRGARVHALSHGPGRGANPLPGRFRGDENARLLDGEHSLGPLTTHHAFADLRERIPVSRRERDAGRPRVVLVPGGARNVMRDDALRRWPVEHYVALARELLSRGHEVVLVGDSGDRQYGDRFANLAVRDEIGRTTLVETMALLRDADLVVSHDTGPLHLARLVGTPIVALFGPTDPRQFVGEGDDKVVALWGGAGLSCRPCYDGRNYARCGDNVCLRGIQVSEVLDAVLRRMPAASLATSGGRLSTLAT